MRTLKTGTWLVVIAGLLAFTYANPDPIAVHIWPGLIWETKAYALVIGALIAGFVPTWLVYRTTRWRLQRRIASLEASLMAQAQSYNEPPPPADPVI